MYYSESRREIEIDPGRGWVWLALLAGMVLNLIPYPDQWFNYKPDFVALILVVYALRLRRPLSFTLVFFVGILMDVAYTATLGQHAFAYCVLLAVATLFRRPFLVAARFHRCIFVLVTLSATLAASLLVSVVYENVTLELDNFYPALVGALVWYLMPVLLLLARAPARGLASTS